MPIKRIKFIDETEKMRILKEQNVLGIPLYGEANITDGDFLLFGEPEPELPSDTDFLTDYVIDVEYRVTMIELGL